MNKFNFIKQLLENEKFSASQKDRFLKLVSKELERSSKREDQVLFDIINIKKKIGFDNVNGKKEQLMSFAQQLAESEKQDIDNKKTNNLELTVPKQGSILRELNAKDIVLEPKDEKIKFPDLKWSSEEKGIPYRKYVKERKGNKEAGLPEFKPPINLSNFLKAYNQHPILKYTCHLIDSDEVIEKINEKCETKNYQFQKHLELIINSFNSFKKDHFVDPKIINLILVYLTGESFTKKIKLWSTDNIKINWSSPELQTWCENNTPSIPSPGLNIARNQKNKGFVFPGFSSNIHDTRIRSFSELVLHFKNLFHLKGDNSLLKIIKNANRSNNWNDIIEFNINKSDFDETQFKENIELFTDVDSLKKGYLNIIKLILESSIKDVKPIVNLSFTSNNNQIIFSIHHINSIITKKSPEDFVARLGESHINIIKNLNGICSLYLKAEFRYNEFLEIKLWDSTIRELKMIPTFKGVEHILKF